LQAIIDRLHVEGGVASFELTEEIADALATLGTAYWRVTVAGAFGGHDGKDCKWQRQTYGGGFGSRAPGAGGLAKQ
jgi:hypothetical protein